MSSRAQGAPGSRQHCWAGGRAPEGGHCGRHRLGTLSLESVAGVEVRRGCHNDRGLCGQGRGADPVWKAVTIIRPCAPKACKVALDLGRVPELSVPTA